MAPSKRFQHAAKLTGIGSTPTARHLTDGHRTAERLVSCV